jgi:hypothetical protein
LTSLLRLLESIFAHPASCFALLIIIHQWKPTVGHAPFLLFLCAAHCCAAVAEKEKQLSGRCAASEELVFAPRALIPYQRPTTSASLRNNKQRKIRFFPLSACSFALTLKYHTHKTRSAEIAACVKQTKVYALASCNGE